MIKNIFSFLFVYLFYLSYVISSNTSYSSSIDSSLTLNQISVLPFSDNANGIYAKPLEIQLKQLIKESHHWNLMEEKIVGPIFTPEELENNETRVKNIIKGLKADAFIAAGIVKHPNSVALTLSLFRKKDSKLFLQVKEKKIKYFEISKLKQKLTEMFKKLMLQIPYRGKILSRRGKSVTVGLGKKDGVQVNQELLVIQIVKITRHPKFHFLINAEKQTLGKIKILKTEETLSFAMISMEIEKNIIQKNSKIAYVNPLKYNSNL